MTAEINWDNGPSTATHYGGGKFWRFQGFGHGWEKECAGSWVFEKGLDTPLMFQDCQERPQPKPKYIYGVEYQTNGQKPDLPGDVLVDFTPSRNEPKKWSPDRVDGWNWENSKCFEIVDERYKPAETAKDAPKPQGPYHRTIIGLDGSKCFVDIYRVLDAFKTDSPALDHAIKKILCPGTRHTKTREQDLKEAIKSIEAELLLMSQR